MEITKQQLLTITLYQNERRRLQAEAKKLQDSIDVLAMAELDLVSSIDPGIDTSKQTIRIDAQAMTAERVDK